MCKALQVRWTITPEIAPQPWITCSGCGGLRAFQSSDKIRLNANGRKLDAWLIYKCSTCGKTWNRPIFERRNVREISPNVLEALRSNDPDWIRAEAFNIGALRRQAQRIEEFPDCIIAKALLHEAPDWEQLEIELVAQSPTCARLDRLLAAELNVSRSRLTTLHDRALLRTQPCGASLLRSRIRNATKVIVNLAGNADRKVVWRLRAIGESLAVRSAEV